MQHIQDSAHRLSFLVKLNLDRLMYIIAIILALNIGGFVGSF